jgi:hypothetical protein
VISQFEGYEKLEEFDWPTYREKHDGSIQLSGGANHSHA